MLGLIPNFREILPQRTLVLGAKLMSCLKSVFLRLPPLATVFLYPMVSGQTVLYQASSSLPLHLSVSLAVYLGCSPQGI